jgi:PEP-CTERM motif-containing protein
MNSRVSDRARRRGGFRGRLIVACSAVPLLRLAGSVALVLLMIGFAPNAARALLFGANASGGAAGNCQSERGLLYNNGTSLSGSAAGESMASGFVTNCAGYTDTSGWSSSASSSANLLLGQLKVFAQASGPLPDGFITPLTSFPNYTTVATSQAQLFDTLHIFGPSDPGTSTIDAIITMMVDGFLDNTGAFAKSEAVLSGFLGPVRGCVADGVSSLPIIGCASAFAVDFPAALFTWVAEVDLSDPFLFVRAGLTAFAGNDAIVDFSATGTLSVELPAGFTFESDSGMFLTGDPVPVPVPEPGSLAIFAIGLAGLGFMGWRRRKRVQLRAA